MANAGVRGATVKRRLWRLAVSSGSYGCSFQFTHGSWHRLIQGAVQMGRHFLLPVGVGGVTATR